ATTCQPWNKSAKARISQRPTTRSEGRVEQLKLSVSGALSRLEQATAGVLGLAASPGSVLTVVLLRRAPRAIVRRRVFGLPAGERGVHARLDIGVAGFPKVGVGAGSTKVPRP